MTPREPMRAAVEAAEKLHPEYSDEWWKTIAQKSDRYGELYATARIKRNVTRAIIQTAIDTATAPLEARLAAAETALAAARRDEERLDWLEKENPVIHYTDGRWNLEYDFCEAGNISRHGISLRAAIDSARASTAPKGKKL